MKKLRLVPAFIAVLFLPGVIFAQFPNLRTASDFALFTASGAVGNTGLSTVIGEIGTNSGAITGFTPVPGQQQNGNAVTAQAVSDLQLAYNEIHAAAATFPAHAAVLGNGETLLPGVYTIPEAASIVGILTLDAQGNTNAKFIIKIEGAFAPGPSSQILLTGGATACNVYWAVEGGAVAIAALANMKGSFIANPGAVSMAAGGQLEGRLLSTTGAIALDGGTVILPICQTALPVTLINFEASRNNSVVELSWKVDNEFSFAGYDLERSGDGANFLKIGSIPSTNSSSARSYKWVDNAPLATMNFYRLKMTDLDNTFKYSSIQKIDMSAKKSMLVYPNPVFNHTILLQMYGQPKGVYNVSVYNLKGEKVMGTTLLQSGNDNVSSISLDSKLITGIYFLHITDPQHNKETFRILIQ